MKLGWFSELTTVERRTYLAAFGGEALDSMDATIYALLTPTLIAVLGLTKPEAGLLASAGLASGAIGGWFGGIMADRYGRVRVLKLTIMLVALSTCGAAFADGFAYLLAARVVQGLGLGAEAAVGAVLIMEVVNPRLRSRIASSIQSSYAVGNALSVALLPVVFSFLPKEIAWRCMFAIGFLPAIAVFFIRRFVPESAAFVEQVSANTHGDPAPPFWAIFTGVHLPKLTVATLFTSALLGAAYVLISWLPTYMVTVLHLAVGSTAGYLAVNIFGSFCGPFAFGMLSDRFGRRRIFRAFLVMQAINVLIYTQAPITWHATIILGYFLGFLQAGLASGLKPTFAELFPTRLRANGVGFAVSAGRGLGSIVPATVGLLAVTWPLGNAMAVCGVTAYVVAFAVSLALPREATGVDLRTIAETGPAGTTSLSASH